MQLHRIVKATRARSAFDGEGARRFGGRWNSPGVPMVYTSRSAYFAMLEMLVHMQSTELLMTYSIVSVEVEDDAIETLEPSLVPAEWQAFPAPSALQRIGDQWVKRGRSLGLSVPSAIQPAERNVLLDPRHAAFGTLAPGDPVPLRFDPRLK